MFVSCKIAFPPHCFQILPIWLQKTIPNSDRNIPILRHFTWNEFYKIQKNLIRFHEIIVNSIILYLLLCSTFKRSSFFCTLQLLEKLREINWQVLIDIFVSHCLCSQIRSNIAFAECRCHGNWFHEIFWQARFKWYFALQYIFPFRPTKLVIHRRKRRKRIWRFSAEVNYWNCFTFTTWFYKLISQNISILTVFGMSKTSLYYPQLFWLILEEEPNWKNFKTLPDASLFRDEITKPLTPF